MEAASSARSGAEAEVGERPPASPLRRAARPPSHSAPWEKPSKVVVPIIAHSSATVPAPAASGGAPESGRRSAQLASRQCSGASRAKRPKYDAEGVGVARPLLDAVERSCRRAGRRRRRRPGSRACSGRRGWCRRARARRRRGCPTAAGQRPSPPGRAAARAPPRRRRPAAHAGAARGRAPRAEGREDVADERRANRHGDPKSDVDAASAARFAVAGLRAREARVDADARRPRCRARRQSDLEHRRGRAGRPARGACCSRGRGQSDGERRRTRRRARRPPPRRRASSGAAGPRGRRRRAPARCRPGGGRPRARPPPESCAAPHGVTSSRATCVSVPCSSIERRDRFGLGWAKLTPSGAKIKLVMIGCCEGIRSHRISYAPMTSVACLMVSLSDAFGNSKRKHAGQAREVDRRSTVADIR